MNKAVRVNHPLFEEVPTPITWDILSRLPVKSCLKCKLVCKEWYRIIVHPDFVHLRGSNGCYPSLLIRELFDKRKPDFMLLDLKTPTKVDEIGNAIISDADATIPFRVKFRNHKGLKLSWVNECNGVICLIKRRDRNHQYGPLYVCNLLTGHYVRVTQVRRTSYVGWLHGLGCCPETHQFKVLRILWSRSGLFVAEIQTLGSNEWRVIGNAPCCHHLGQEGTFLNGSLHWYYDRNKCIWSFHFGNERFSRIPLPDELTRIQMSALDSCLCVSRYFYDSGRHQCDVWVMKEYGVSDSWVKRYVFDIGQHLLVLKPMLRMGGEQLLGYCNNGRLMVGDIKSGTVKYVSIPKVSDRVYPVLCNANFSNKLKSAQGSDA